MMTTKTKKKVSSKNFFRIINPLMSSSNQDRYWWILAREFSNICMTHSSSPVFGSHQKEDDSINIVGGGIGSWAYIQYEASKNVLFDEVSMISARDAALQALNHSEMFSSNSEQSISILTNSKLGAHALLAVSNNQLNQSFKGRLHLRILLKIWRETSIANPDLWSGKAGALQGIFFLRRELASPEGATDLVISMAAGLLEALNKPISGREGMKHGRIGILYTLLGLHQDEWKILEKEVPNAKQSINDIVSSNYLQSISSSDISWEYGITGQILLLSRAFQVFGSMDYLEKAHQLTKEILLPTLSLTSISKLGLADGVLGVAFALRYMGEALASEKLVKTVIRQYNSDVAQGDYMNFSLFYGLGGLVFSLLDMANASSISDLPSSKMTNFPFLHPPIALYNTNFDSSEKTNFALSKKICDGFPFIKLSHINVPATKPISCDDHSSSSFRVRSRLNGYNDWKAKLFNSSDPSTFRSLLGRAKNSPSSASYNTSMSRETNGRLARRLQEQSIQNTSPGGTILTGGLGAACFLRLKMSETILMNNPNRQLNTLKAALSDAKSALKVAENRKSTFCVSIFTGEYVGAKCLYAATLYKLNRKEEAFEHACHLIRWLEDACDKLPVEECDIMYGRAGALKTIWFLRQELDDSNLGHELVLLQTRSILIEGMTRARKIKSELLLAWAWKGKTYLGAAHGVVGILHALLGLSKKEWMIIDQTLPRARDVVLQTIISLKLYCRPSGNLMKKIEGKESKEHANLIHGSPGYILLLVKAIEVFEDMREEFLNLAREMAEALLLPSRKNLKNCGLMRGISGIAYVLMGLARSDLRNRSKWLTHAEEYVHTGLNDLQSLILYSSYPYSLEGAAGLSSLFIDLGYPETAHMPFFENRPSVFKSFDDKSLFTASTAPSTRLNTPLKSQKRQGSLANAMSPQTDPKITPEKQ
jgi:hypothetical protein